MCCMLVGHDHLSGAAIPFTELLHNHNIAERLVEILVCVPQCGWEEWAMKNRKKKQKDNNNKQTGE